MRIAFAGTPAFAAAALSALLEAGYEVGLVLCQPDRPAGRGQRLQPGPVRKLALERGIAALVPASLRPERGGDEARAAVACLREYAPDVLVVAAYGLLLPEAVLRIPAGLAVVRDDGSAGRAGAVNVHASLLPRWRGAAPVVRAIEAGDARTGISIMEMEAGLDTGPVLLSRAVDIDPAATAGTLTAELAALGGRMMVETLQLAARGALRARAQPSAGATYARKVEKHERWIDWELPADVLARKLRAFDPFPGACALLGGTVIKLWRGHALEAWPPGEAASAAPGGIVAAGPEGLIVRCGPQAGPAPSWLCVTELQRPGGRRLAAREFLAAIPIVPGSDEAHLQRPRGEPDED
jgi:methionyl-tRNA formyltransferase